MRRRLDLAASLVGRPAVIFLDEPTTGLDPAKREDMWEVVRRLVAEGSTVLLTTQYLEEADALADEITVIDHGRVIAHDTPDGLKRVVGGQRLEVRPDRPRPAATTSARDPRRGRRRARRRPPAAARSPCRSTTTARSPRPSPRLAAARHRASPNSPCTCPAWTRCSSTLTGRPRPTTDAPRRSQHDHHDHRPHRRPAPRRRRPAADAATPSAPTSGTSLALAKRSLIKTWRTPEALIDVTLQPIIFLLLFTYVFGGAIAGGSQHDYLQFLLPGLLGQSIAMAGIALGQNLNADIEKGVFDRFRSLPIARSAPLVGAVARRLRALPDPRAWSPSASARCMGFRVETSAGRGARRASALAIAFALCFCWISVFVGMIARTAGRGAGHHVPARPAAHLRQQHLRRRPSTHAGLAAGLRQRQPDHPPGRHGPRADARRAGGRHRWLDAALDGGAAAVVFVPLALRGYRRRA